MKALGRWLFGDIVSVVAPRVERGPRRAPTRRSARWLIGIGVFVTLFGVIGFTSEGELEKQSATVVGRYTTRLRTGAAVGRIHKVTLQFEDGTTKSIPQAPLYDAVGTRTGVPVTVDLEPETHLVDAVYLEGHRYPTGRQSAYVVITLLFAVFGAFLLLRGIGRRRRARLLERSANTSGLPGG